MQALKIFFHFKSVAVQAALALPSKANEHTGRICDILSW